MSDEPHIFDISIFINKSQKERRKKEDFFHFNMQELFDELEDK